MRLWHESLIPLLPRQQLLGQHRECCALRGKGWAKPHTTVNYVFQYAPERLYRYHVKVMKEMKQRGYRIDPLWENPFYRGKQCPPYNEQRFYDGRGDRKTSNAKTIYPEHDSHYLDECLQNLQEKGVFLSMKDIKDVNKKIL